MLRRVVVILIKNKVTKVNLSNRYSKILGLLLIMILSACGTKESIEPAYEAVSIDSQLETKPLEVSLNIDDLEIEEFGTDFSSIAELGPVFQELAGHLANIAIEENGQGVDIDPIIYYANELDQIEDWSYFGKMGIKKIRLNIQESEDLELANLDFIEDIKVYIDFKEPVQGQLVREEGQGMLVASYSHGENTASLGCNGKCIDLVIEDIEWIEILKKERVFTIYPELKVNKVPKVKMSVGGEVGVFVGLKLGL